MIVETEMRKMQHCERIVGFDYLFGTRMREPPVTDENTESARIQVALARCGYGIVDRGQTQRVVGAMPAIPLYG